MFETALVRARAADRRLLSFSLLVHASIVAAVVAASLASTRLPHDSPKQMMPVFFSSPPPPLGTTATAPPRTVAPPRTAAQTPLPVLRTIAAPNVIPEQISTVTLDPGPGTRDAGGGGQVGVPWGTPGGVGTPDAAPGAPAAAGPLVAGVAGVTSPIVIRRIEPAYPPLPLRAHMSGIVVLQCVIDKTGHIRDVRVAHSSFPAFEQPAIDAVQQWLFAPGTLNGQPVDTIFELTVKFEVR